MMAHYTVTQLACGDRGKPNEAICVLADVRNWLLPDHLVIWSAPKHDTIAVKRLTIRRIFTRPGARWTALSLPRWLVRNESLWDSARPPARAERPEAFDASDASDYDLALYAVNRENKYVILPGERLSSGKADRRNGAISA